MPTYDYKCSECDHIFERSSMISERNIPETEPCPSCSKENCVHQYFGNGAAAIVDPVSIGRRKPDSGFKEVLHKIHEGMPKSNLDKSRFF